MNRSLKAICVLAIVAGAANFLWFFLSSMQLGGDALNGYQEAGRYYVASSGESTEVDESVWRRNRSQGLSLRVTHPLMLAAMFYIAINEEFPKIIFRGEKETRDQKEAAIRLSDRPKLSFSCGGKIGTLNLSGSLLTVTVYAKGIHVKPMFMPAFALLSTEIVSVSEQRYWTEKGMEIIHTSPEVANPIFFKCMSNQAAVSALTLIKLVE